MQRAPLPLDESSRLASLHRLHVLDSPAEERFDRVIRLAQRVFDVSIVAVALVDSTRVWFKSMSGLSLPQVSRDISFASHAIHGNETYVVVDASSDPRFSENPLVIGEPYVKFYAGCPLLAEDGSVLGTLELLDSKSQEFSKDDRQSLRDFAKIVESALNTVTHTAAQEEILSAAGATSRVDPLTRLWTRAAIVDILQRELAHARREGSSVGILLADIDHLRELNNEHGHDAGDAALREVTRRLRACLRPYDAVGRFGGEEFLAVLPSTDPDGCVMAAERVRLSIANEGLREANNAFVSMSIGAIVSDANQSDTGTLIRAVEQALFKAKSSGGNRVHRA